MTIHVAADSPRLLRVQPAQDGQRVDRFLRQCAPGMSRSAVVRAIAAGAVRVNGRRVRKGHGLREGDAVEVDGPLSVAAQADDRVPLQVAFADGPLLIVDKPAGLPCHPLRAGETTTLASALLARYPELAGVGDDPREPGLVHRLDTDTSGLLLVARDQLTWTALRAALRRGAIEKTYLARCQPRPSVGTLARGMYRAFLAADRGRRVWVGDGPRPGARVAETEVRAWQRLPDGSCLVEVRVHCARRHQVRAHLSALGYPLLGDGLYGGPERAGGHLLHAIGLRLTHPGSGVPIVVHSPPPAALRA